MPHLNSSSLIHFATPLIVLCLAQETFAERPADGKPDGATTAVGQPAAENSASSVAIRVLRSDPLKHLQNGEPTNASLIEVTFPPQASSEPHRHPGPVTGYVLEGTFEFAVADEPVRTLRQGDTFFEPSGILHRVSRNPDASRPCRILVTMVHPSDAKRLVLPADDATVTNVRQGRPNQVADTDTGTCTIDMKDSVNRNTLDESLPTIGILLFDDVLMTEVTAPIDVFSKPDVNGNRLFNVVTIARSLRPVPMESGLRVLPDFSFDDCPELDVIVVSSSYDMAKIVASEEIVEFVKSRGEHTEFTMSNCAGAHLIGASGVADGRKIVTYIGGGKDLQARYPNLSVQDDSQVSFVRDGKMFSSNGNLASYLSALELLQQMTSKQHREFVESRVYLDRLRGSTD